METWCRWENARKGSSCGLDRIHSSDGAGTPRVTRDLRDHLRARVDARSEIATSTVRAGGIRSIGLSIPKLGTCPVGQIRGMNLQCRFPEFAICDPESGPHLIIQIYVAATQSHVPEEKSCLMNPKWVSYSPMLLDWKELSVVSSLRS